MQTDITQRQLRGMAVIMSHGNDIRCKRCGRIFHKSRNWSVGPYTAAFCSMTCYEFSRQEGRA